MSDYVDGFNSVIKVAQLYMSVEPTPYWLGATAKQQGHSNFGLAVGQDFGSGMLPSAILGASIAAGTGSSIPQHLYNYRKNGIESVIQGYESHKESLRNLGNSYVDAGKDLFYRKFNPDMAAKTPVKALSLRGAGLNPARLAGSMAIGGLSAMGLKGGMNMTRNALEYGTGYSLASRDKKIDRMNSTIREGSRDISDAVRSGSDGVNSSLDRLNSHVESLKPADPRPSRLSQMRGNLLNRFRQNSSHE